MTSASPPAAYSQPRPVWVRALSRAGRSIESYRRATRDLLCGTSGPAIPSGCVEPLQRTESVQVTAGCLPALHALAEHVLQGEFHLLGSGWAKAGYGAASVGLGGYHYPAGPQVSPDKDGRWLREIVNRSNWRASGAVWALVDDSDYQPLDWQRDVRSGYRWSARQPSSLVAFGTQPGVDIKLPWELARTQHLPQMALLYSTLGQERQPTEEGQRLVRCFRNHLLDFIATNPLRFGVNWRCPMDVAIRAANWLLAFDLFHAAGVHFDVPFLQTLTRSLWEHGRHIVNHLEWFPDHRGNHYLSDVVGLIFIAAHLPRTSETDAWLAFGRQELIAETDHQFLDDGGNFEGSVCYHRLSAELVLFATALLAGLPEERRQAFREFSPQVWKRTPSLTIRPLEGTTPDEIIPERLRQRLIRAAEFTQAVTKPNGRVHQVGDNDSGRLFRLQTAPENTSDPDVDVTALCHQGWWAGMSALFPQAVRQPAEWSTEAAVIRWLANGVEFADVSVAIPVARITQTSSSAKLEGDVATTRVNLPATTLGVRRLHAFPQFGLYIWRGADWYVGVRCGRLAAGSGGGHAHLDQLSVEIHAEGRDLWSDPGTYVYTPLPGDRNRYRSVSAHTGPRLQDGREPGSLAKNLFWLDDWCQAECLEFTSARFVGRHSGYGFVITRTVWWDGSTLVIEDTGPAGCGLLPPGPSDVPFSAGYGEVADVRHRAA